MLKRFIAAHPSFRDDIGDLVTRRPVPGPRLPQLDPFLFLNHHGPQTYPPNNQGLPFGPHPHRGFETVTFILDGELAHRDSAGHESVIRAGGMQWMTAGRGIVHAELSPDSFKRDGGPMEILQLWLNLPGRLKMSPPRYVGLQADEIPVLDAGDGATLHLIAGERDGRRGPVETLTHVFIATLKVATGGRFRADGLAGRQVFLYAVRGEATVNGARLPAHHLAELDVAGDRLEVEADADAVLLFGHGEPIGEPVVAHGPFVMNTREEILQAVRDYQAGLFG